MVNSEIERRRFKRIFFSKKDGVMADIRFSDKTNGHFNAKVLNLSEGGIFVTPETAEEQIKKFSKGDLLTLTKISGTTPELDIDETEMEIKWLLRDGFLDHIGLGCEFVNITESTRKQLVQLVVATDQVIREAL